MEQFKLFQPFPNLVHAIDADLSHFKRDQIVELDQIHSAKILLIKSYRRKRQLQNRVRQADGLITNLPHVYLTIHTADCVPIFMFDPDHHAVGLIHAGWRGIDKKIHLKALSKFKHHFQSTKLFICLGPSICSKCYRQDLFGQIKADFLSKKIPAQYIEISSVCTFENKNYPSYQRDQDDKRFISLIGYKQCQMTKLK